MTLDRVSIPNHITIIIDNPIFRFKKPVEFCRLETEKTRGCRDLALVPGERRPMVVAMVENETAGEDRRREGVDREEVKRGSYVR